MCVRWPNWECRQLKNGESGYLDFKEVRAGIDTWYDGSRQLPESHLQEDDIYLCYQVVAGCYRCHLTPE